MTEVTPLSGAALAAAIGAVTFEGQPVPVLGQRPGRLSPPAIVVDYGNPWIDNTEGLPHGVFAYSYNVRVVAGHGTNTRQQDRLVELVQTVIARLTGSDVWQVGQTGAPFPLAIREDVIYLAADISVTAYASITED